MVHLTLCGVFDYVVYLRLCGGFDIMWCVWYYYAVCLTSYKPRLHVAFKPVPKSLSIEPVWKPLV